MADMPSSSTPPIRPAPPSRSNSRSPRRQQFTPQPREQGQHLRPPQSPGREAAGETVPTPNNRQDGGDPGRRRSNGSAPDGATGFANERGRSQNEGGGEGEEEAEAIGQEEEEEPDYYATLNVSRDATSNQIRAAYHSLSRRFHPDKHPPALRAHATVYFNKILVAYETLANPRKRIVYDRFGFQGLKDRTWQVGRTQSMSPEEFRIWLEEQVRRQRVESVDSLVRARGEISVTLNTAGYWYTMAQESLGEDGVRRIQILKVPPLAVEGYSLKHSFTVPLEGLGGLLTYPIPSLDELRGKKEPSEIPAVQGADPPGLTFAATISTTPAGPLGGGQPIMTSPSLSATLSHSFPSLSSKSPLSIGSILAGMEFSTTATLFPRRGISTTIRQHFGATTVRYKTIFTSSPLIAPPNIDVDLARRVSARGVFFMNYRSGVWAWPSAISSLMKQVTQEQQQQPPINDQTGVSIGYLSTSEYLESTRTFKETSKWTTSIATGKSMDIQIATSWTRRLFIATPIPTLPPQSQPSNNTAAAAEPIKLAVQATIGIISGPRWTIRASRKVFENTSLGLFVSVADGTPGIMLGMTWHRLGQRIAIPIVIVPVMDMKAAVYTSLIPFFGYAFLETLILRPIARAQRRQYLERKKKKLKDTAANKRQKAAQAVELLRPIVERRMLLEKEIGGLVILEARYGLHVDRNLRRGHSEWIDVTIPVGGLMGSGQVVIPRRLKKSKIIGFCDPAPGEEKQLMVKYLLNGEIHQTIVGDKEALVIPMRAHLVPR